MSRTSSTALVSLAILGAAGACAQTAASDTPSDQSAESTAGQTTAPLARTPDSTAAPEQTVPPAQSMEPNQKPPEQTGVPKTNSREAMTGQAISPTSNAKPATSADITAGATVSDINGVMVGTINSVDATGVVLNVGKQRVKLPIASFGKDSNGLMIATTKADFETKISAAQANQPSATDTQGQPTSPPEKDMSEPDMLSNSTTVPKL